MKTKRQISKERYGKDYEKLNKKQKEAVDMIFAMEKVN